MTRRPMGRRSASNFRSAGSTSSEVSAFTSAVTSSDAFDTPAPTYGRLALIHCDGLPAIELLEIVAPEKT